MTVVVIVVAFTVEDIGILPFRVLGKLEIVVRVKIVNSKLESSIKSLILLSSGLSGVTGLGTYIILETNGFLLWLIIKWEYML